MVTHIHRIIHTIGEKVITTNISSNTGDRIIRINPPTNLRIVITAGYIIEPGFGIVVVTAIAERVVRAKCSCQGAGGGYQLATRIINIFYHTHAAFVYKANYIILAVSQVTPLAIYRIPFIVN